MSIQVPTGATDKEIEWVEKQVIERLQTSDSYTEGMRIRYASNTWKSEQNEDIECNRCGGIEGIIYQFIFTIQKLDGDNPRRSVELYNLCGTCHAKFHTAEAL